MLTPENNQTEIMRRQSEYQPPHSLSHCFIGRPLSTAGAPDRTIGKRVSLAVFALDTLFSTAYATQELLSKPQVVVTDVPYDVHNEEKEQLL
jgi:hypothetical protein